MRNSGKEPLTRLALQISSSLHWESFAQRSGERVSPLSFTEQTIDTDADHTGKAKEAVVSLAQPLESGATLELTSLYSGEVTQSAERLERIGAPLDQAAHADWDQISPRMDCDCADSGTFCGIRPPQRRYFWAMARSSFNWSGRPSCNRPPPQSICG